MASFDIAQAAGNGYAQLWKERQYLIRLAAVPLLIKLVCFTAVLRLGWEREFLLFSLVMLPSYFADGWLFSHLVRMVLLGQRWPFRPTGDAAGDMRVLQDRALGVMRGTLTYVLSRFLLGAVMAFFTLLSERVAEGPESGAINFVLFVAALGSFIFFLWGFRLLWLYVPASVNYPLSRFMRKLGGFGASWVLIGTWMLCFVPVFLITGMMLSLLDSLIGGAAPSAAVIFIVTVLRMGMELLVGIITAIAFAHGFRQMLSS